MKPNHLFIPLITKTNIYHKTTRIYQLCATELPKKIIITIEIHHILKKIFHEGKSLFYNTKSPNQHISQS